MQKRHQVRLLRPALDDFRLVPEVHGMQQLARPGGSTPVGTDFSAAVPAALPVVCPLTDELQLTTTGLTAPYAEAQEVTLPLQSHQPFLAAISQFRVFEMRCNTLTQSLRR